MEKNQKLEVYKRPDGRELIVVQDSSEFAYLLDTAKFQHLWSVAEVYAKAKITPEHFRNDPSSIFIVLEMALRLHAHPFTLLQNTYLVHGRPGFESKFIIAVLNSSGRLKGPLDWKSNGKAGDEGGVICFATLDKSNKAVSYELTWSTVKKEGWLSKQGSKWLTMPDMMFRYRSAMFLARLYFPDLLMGIYTKDEIEDFSVSAEAERGVVIEHAPAPAPAGALVSPPSGADQHAPTNGVKPIWAKASGKGMPPDVFAARRRELGITQDMATHTPELLGALEAWVDSWAPPPPVDPKLIQAIDTLRVAARRWYPTEQDLINHASIYTHRDIRFLTELSEQEVADILVDLDSQAALAEDTPPADLPKV